MTRSGSSNLYGKESKLGQLVGKGKQVGATCIGKESKLEQRVGKGKQVRVTCRERKAS